MFVVKYRKIFYSISTIIIIAAIAAISIWGLKPGIDFTGGSLLSIEYAGTADEVKALLPQASVRSTEGGYIVRTSELSQVEKNEILESLGAFEKEFSTVGPVLGAEAIRKSYISIILVLLAIVLFITFAFRKVSKPVSSWVYASIAIVALAHDVIVPTGIFALLGYLAGVEVDTLFVTALLVILGFSVHDTIVVFDRVRENLNESNARGGREEFESIVGRSISETLIRSLNTSLTTLFAIAVLYFVGPEATRHFALAMGIGIIAGTYSSIFIGSPLLVTIQKFKNRK